MSPAERTDRQGSYEIRPLDLSERGLVEIEALLRIVYPGATNLDRAHLDWTYVRNPEGPAMGCNAYAPDGTLVAHCACPPLRARVFGKTERGLLSLNVATHPDHRGQALYARITADCLERSAEAGFGFVVGAANQQSTPSFIEKLHFRLIRPLEARFGLAPLPAPTGRSDVEFERLWSEETLAWRLAPPTPRYSVRRENGTTRVYAAAGRFGASVEMARLPAGLVPASLPDFRSKNPLRLWIGADPDRRWSRSLTLDLPLRWRPSPLNWIFFDLRHEGRAPRPDAIRVGALDFDAF